MSTLLTGHKPGRRRTGYIFLFVVCLFALSCSKNDVPAPSAAAAGTEKATGVQQALYFAPGQLEAHYLKHAYQFGDISQEDYLEDARALLTAPIGRDVLEKRRANGDILRYRVNTGEFAVETSEGRIKTFFKTDYAYWMRQ